MASLRKLAALGLLLFALVASFAVSHGDGDADFWMKRGGGGRGSRFRAPRPAKAATPDRLPRGVGETPEKWEDHEGGGFGKGSRRNGREGGRDARGGSHHHHHHHDHGLGLGEVEAPTPVGKGLRTEGIPPRPAKGGYHAGAPQRSRSRHGKRFLGSRVLRRGEEEGFHSGSGNAHSEGIPQSSRSGEASERGAEAPRPPRSGETLERGAEAPRAPKTPHGPPKSPKGGRH